MSTLVVNAYGWRIKEQQAIRDQHHNCSIVLHSGTTNSPYNSRTLTKHYEPSRFLIRQIPVAFIYLLRYIDPSGTLSKSKPTARKFYLS